MPYTAELSETSNTPDWIHIDFEAKSFSTKLSIYRLEDNGYCISYVPSLNLSGYGDTVEQADNMLIDVIVDDYSDSLLAMSRYAVLNELSKFGWSISGRDMGNFENAAHADKDGILRNFNLPQDTKIEEGELSLA